MLVLALNALTAAEVYHDLQARLARYASVSFITVPTSGNGWDHEGEYSYLRPDKGFRHQPNFGFATDGRLSGGVGLANDEPRVRNAIRPARKGDLARYMAAPGFESFFDPAIHVVGEGPPRRARFGKTDLIALDLALDGATEVLYLNTATRLPFGYGFPLPPGGEDYLAIGYRDVRLGAPILSASLKPIPWSSPQH